MLAARRSRDSEIPFIEELNVPTGIKIRLTIYKDCVKIYALSVFVKDSA